MAKARPPATATGVSALPSGAPAGGRNPAPSCPSPPHPQQYAAPAGVRAQVCQSPALTELKVTGSALTVAEPLMPSLVAMMRADPAARVDTSPLSETVATDGLSLDHWT